MNFFEIFISAFYTIIGNKLRTILTMIGIIIGVSAVIMILSTGNGFKSAMQKELEVLETDNVIILPDYKNLEKTKCTMNLDETEFLKKYKQVIAVIPELNMYLNEEIRSFNNNKLRICLEGIDEEYYKFKIMEKLLYGRIFTKEDIKNKNNIAIINNNDAKKIFGYEDIIGKEINVNTDMGKKSFTIVGVCENKFKNFERSTILLYVPITYVQDMKFADKDIDTMTIKVSDKNQIKEITKNIINLLKLKNKGEDVEYETIILAEAISDVNNIINIFSLFLSLVASISLLVGGIGVMNIMLVSVTERTKEIGIRKSLGATNLNIEMQFIIEAITISILGGMLGIIFGYIGSIVISNFGSKLLQLKIIPFINILNILLIFTISLVIGILFGVYPAVKAAKLNPVESLSFE